MDAERELFITSDGYEIELPGFSGPLDLLLQLIRREAYDVFDIPISKLTAAYLETLDDFQGQGFEIAAGFLALAAQLVHLKSQLMLPKSPQQDVQSIQDDDPRENLVYQLLVYESIQDVAAQLGNRDLLFRDTFLCQSKNMRSQRSEGEFTVTDAGRLALALQGILSKKQFAPPHEIYVERISIGERIAEISTTLAGKGRVSFASLCARLESREEVITTFLALLEMARLSLLTVVQQSAHAPLYLKAKVDNISEEGEDAAGTGPRL